MYFGNRTFHLIAFQTTKVHVRSGTQFLFYLDSFLSFFQMEHTFNSYPDVTFQSPRNWHVENCTVFSILLISSVNIL